MTGPDLATPEAGDQPEDGARRRAGRGPLVALVVLTVLLAVSAIVLAVLLRSEAQDDDARDAALQAARQSALNLTSIDTANFDDDVARVVDGATGDFLEDFQARSTDLRGILAENQVVSEGTVIEAGLVRGDRDGATALVVVDSTVKNTAAPEGRVNTYRMRIELERRDGRWLTSQLEFVG